MRRVLTALVLGSVAVLLAMGPASADVLGDAISPKGDIVTGNYTVSFTDDVVSNVKLKVTTLQSVDPETAPAWQNTNTEIRGFIDLTSAHLGPDYRVTLSSIGGNFVATVHSLLSDGDVVCGATATYVAAQNLYKANVPGTCFTELSATQLRARFEMTWDPPPAGGTSTDKSPNSGWGPFLVAA